MGYGDYVPRVGPQLDRRIDFKIAGGVRLGPSTQIGSWLAQGLKKHFRKDSTFTMKGESDSPLRMVASGKADLCYSTTHGATAALVENSSDGRLTSLRAICSLPKRDWYQFAVPVSYGVSSIEELVESRCPLRLAVPAGSTPSGVSQLQHLVLSSYGVDPKTLETWGGRVIVGESTRPHEHVGRVLSGEADSVFEDGVAVNSWWKLFATREMRILPIGQEVRGAAHRNLGYKSTIIPKGWYYGKIPDRDIPTIDTSGFVVLVNEAMDDELAYFLAFCAVEYKAEIEAEYNFLPPERCSLTYPLMPSDMATGTSQIPLHKGAEKYYREKAIL